jgi:hypothetical protein
LLTGYEFGDDVIEDDSLKRSFLPSVHTIVRENQLVDNFTPSLIELSDAEVAKIEKTRIREAR